MASPTTLNYGGNDASLLANGATVQIGPLTVTLGGDSLASRQAECVLGTGQADAPAGSTNFGFTDTTYTLTTAQIAALAGLPS